jgi:hypothetical protein
MIKGLILGVSLSGFITSLIFFISGASGMMSENIITGAVVGSVQVAGYSVMGMFLSGICIFLTALRMKK